MHHSKAPFFALLFIAALSACASSYTNIPVQETYNGYDELLAEQLGADEYGMRLYVFVVLSTGPAIITDENHRKEIFAGHFSNMGRLATEGKLVLAGPFIEGGKKRGLYIFNQATIEEAEALVSTDPAVVAGIFTAEYTKFYGSAALVELNKIHKKIQKTKIG
ncbi:MAG: hypothetical protein GXP06_10970 [Alphaproteobacteria bacterium]|nr:hypothetical protein [Alphaproteobacteria bacterium]